MTSLVELPFRARSSFLTNETLFVGVGSAVYEMKDRNVRELRRFSGSSTSLRCLFVSRTGSLFASPEGTSLGDLEKGLWRRSVLEGEWSRVLSLSERPNPVSIWSLAESPSGRLYAGVYTTAPHERQAEIWLSADDGVSWQRAYFEASARHVHHIEVDGTTDAVYASLGDDFGHWGVRRILRSSDGGISWEAVLDTMPQVVPILALPGARIFGSDCPGGARIFRTTDDQTYETVLHDPNPLYFFWMRRDADNGSLFASAIKGKQECAEARIYRSTDEGRSWQVALRMPAEAKSDGSAHASNALTGRMVLHVCLAGTACHSLLWRYNANEVR